MTSRYTLVYAAAAVWGTWCKEESPEARWKFEIVWGSQNEAKRYIPIYIHIWYVSVMYLTYRWTDTNWCFEGDVKVQCHRELHNIINPVIGQEPIQEARFRVTFRSSMLKFICCILLPFSTWNVRHWKYIWHACRTYCIYIHICI